MKQRLTQAPYDRKQVGQDLSSGGIAAMSMLPFALAFGALAGIGMPAGLIAAVGASLVTALVPGRVPYFAGPVCIVFLVFSACAGRYGLPAALTASFFAGKQLFRHQCNRRQRSGYAALLPQLWFSCKLEDSALWHNRAGADDYLSA